MNCVSIVLCFVFVPFCIADLTNLECYNGFVKNADCCKGYRKIEDECAPICEGGCPVSQLCLEPNVCGFKPYKFYIVQRTACSKYSYNERNYCGKCNPTHILVKGQCTESCDHKCINGFCDSSDGGSVCICNPGYQKNPKTASCELKDCVNKNCQNFSSSTTVEISTNSNNDFTNSIAHVKSNCQNECNSGICIDGLCQRRASSIEENHSNSPKDVTSGVNCIGGICQEYQANSLQTQEETTTDRSSTSVEAFTISAINVTSNCQNDCQNGICTQDGACKCNQGYILSNDSQCIPQCDRDCANIVSLVETNKPGLIVKSIWIIVILFILIILVLGYLKCKRRAQYFFNEQFNMQRFRSTNSE